MLKKILKYRKIIVPALAFVGFLLTFVSGFFASKTHFEKVSEYAASVTVNNTANKKFCCLTAERKDKSVSLPDPETEFRSLYGVFAQRKITFSSVINPDKAHDIRIGDSLTNNLSAFYVGPVGSMVYEDSDGNSRIRHHVYPIELMFEDDKEYEKKTSTNFYAYISQSQADIVLEKIYGEEKEESTGKYSIESYKKLLLQNVPFTVDGGVHDFAILNIYYEENYYYEGLSEVVGDFIMTSYTFPNDLRNERKNLYYLNDNSYQNRYFMEYIRNVYDESKYNIKVNHFNIIGEIDDDYLVSFFNENERGVSNTASNLLAVLSGTILLVALFMHGYSNLKIERIGKSFTFLCLIVSLIPYLLFKLIFRLTNNVIFMSEAGSKLNCIYLIIYISVMLFSFFIIRKKHSIDAIVSKEYYELDI